MTWRHGRALEEEIFMSVPSATVTALIVRAHELTDIGLVDAHIRTKSAGKDTLATVLADGAGPAGFSAASRQLLGESSKIKKAGWYKSVTKMQGVAHDIIGPQLDVSDPEFKAIVVALFTWIVMDLS